VIPFVVMAVAIGLLRLAGALGAPFLDDWMLATRLGLAVMFLYTGLAHFGRERRDLIRMVPPALPFPALLVTVTGIAQLVLAVLLMWPDTAPAAGLALMVLLIVMFPANIHAARTGESIGGRPHAPFAIRLPLQVVWIGLVWWSAACRSCWWGDAGDPSRPVVHTTDLHRFVDLALPSGALDTTCAGLDRYFGGASPGLEAYRRKYDVGPAELCAAILRTPERYVALADQASRLDSVAQSVSAAFTRFRLIYPEARIVPVYLVVGNGISGGTTTLGRRPVILIGAELAAKTAGLERTILHELMHVQQRYPAWGAMTGGPEFLRGTLLRHAIKEGAADFLVELVLGGGEGAWRGTREAWAAPREAELWREFRGEMHGKDYSGWLYNGWNRTNLSDRPPDMGYYMGYAIARSYYENAADKAAAVRDMLTIRDFDRFLARSGYQERWREGPRDRYVD
jgi:uncharacterized membrane protein